MRLKRAQAALAKIRKQRAILKGIPEPVGNPATLTFREFVTKVRPRFQWYRHCEVLADVLQRVADGEITRLMVREPPRHGKSEEVSRLFSAYYLYRYPERFVGLNSYAADLAYTLSRAARDNYKTAGGKTRDDADAVRQWETPDGGGMWAAGVGGPITGKGFHLGIVDDPLKNAQEAASEIVREGQKEWYRSTFYTREEPGGAIILVMTSWNEDDLICWQLAEELTGEEPEHWHIVDLAAIAEEKPQQYPPTCTVEPDWRKPGEALCPERYPIEKLRKIAAKIGEYFWGALFQQRPTAKSGSFFKVEKIAIETVAPVGLKKICRDWDIAASEGEGDYTAGVKMAVDTTGRFWVLDVVRGQFGTDQRDAVMKQTAQLDGVGVQIGIPQDPGAAGKSLVLSMTRMFAGFRVKSASVSGDKETRADSFSSQVNAGNVSMVKAPWNADYISELRAFPRGKKDDQVDASADAFNALNAARTGNVY